MRIRPKHYSQLIDRAIKQGCVVTRTKNDHLKITTPNGTVVFGPMTASDVRSWRNVRATLKRQGLNL